MSGSGEHAPGARILDAAERLFYAHGIQAIGVDRVALEAQVSKRTLYKHFASKDELVAACLQRRADALLKPGSSDAMANLMSVFDRLARTVEHERFRGCPFVNAVAELGGSAEHAAAVKVAREYKRARLGWFEEQLRALGVAAPEALAAQLMILVEGATAASLVRGGDPQMATRARDAARVLLSAAGVALPAPEGSVEAISARR